MTRMWVQRSVGKVSELLPPAVRGQLSAPIQLRHSGERDLAIDFELVGARNAPVIVVAGGISAHRHAFASDRFPEAGWWQPQAPSFDLDRLQILGVDWIGANGQLDALIDPVDQAQALAKVLDQLGVAQAAAFIGASYGAMVGMHFASLFPHRIGLLVGLCAADRPHPFASALRAVQRRIIELGERSDENNIGVGLARALGILTYRSAEEFARRFDAPLVENGRVCVGADEYLRAQGHGFAERLSPVAYRRLSESIDLHLVDPAQIRCPVTLVAADSDQLVPAPDVRRLARELPNAEYRCIHSIFGHDAFLKEPKQIDAILSPLLSQIEAAQ